MRSAALARRLGAVLGAGLPAVAGEGRVSEATPPALEQGRVATYTRTAPEPAASRHRMPRFEDLPIPAQNEIKAQRGEAPASETPDKRRMSLLQRLASVGLGRREEEPAAVRPAVHPALDSVLTRPRLPRLRLGRLRSAADSSSVVVHRPAVCGRELATDAAALPRGVAAVDDDAAAARVREIVRTTGALAVIEQPVRASFEQALDALRALDEPARGALERLATRALFRDG